MEGGPRAGTRERPAGRPPSTGTCSRTHPLGLGLGRGGSLALVVLVLVHAEASAGPWRAGGQARSPLGCGPWGCARTLLGLRSEEGAHMERLRGGLGVKRNVGEVRRQTDEEKIMRSGSSLYAKAVKMGAVTEADEVDPDDQDQVLEQRYQQALKKLEKRRREDAKEMREQRAGLDEQSRKDAVDMQNMIMEGRTHEFYKLTDRGKAEEKEKRLEAMQRNRTRAMKEVLVEEYTRRAKEGNTSPLTEEEVVRVVEKAYNKTGSKLHAQKPEVELPADKRQGPLVVTGWKAINKESLRLRKSMSRLEREDMDHDEMQRDGKSSFVSAEAEAHFLKEAFEMGRFKWPPDNFDAPNVTRDCERCARLFFEECLCTDAYGDRLRGRKREEAGEVYHVYDGVVLDGKPVEQTGSRAEDEEEQDGLLEGLAGKGRDMKAVKREMKERDRQKADNEVLEGFENEHRGDEVAEVVDDIERAKEVNWRYIEEECRLELIDPPITPEIARELNKTGDLPWLGDGEPQTRFVAARTQRPSWFPARQPGLPSCLPQARCAEDAISVHPSMRGLWNACQGLKNGDALFVRKGVHDEQGEAVVEWEKGLPEEDERLVVRARDVSVVGEEGCEVQGQWLFEKGGRGRVEGVNVTMDVPPRVPEKLTKFDNAKPFKDLMTADDDEGAATGDVYHISNSEVDEEEREERERKKEEEGGVGVFACVGVCGGEWLFDCVSIRTNRSADALRMMKRSFLIFRRGVVGGMGNDTRAGDGVTQMHRSRLIMEWSTVEFTVYAAMRQLDRSRCALDHCRFRCLGEYGLCIDLEAHTVLRDVEFEDCYQPGVRLSKACYADRAPLYLPSRFCSWCTKWFPQSVTDNDSSLLDQGNGQAYVAASEREEDPPQEDEGPQGSFPFEYVPGPQDDSDAGGGEWPILWQKHEGRDEADIGMWLYNDETLEGQRFEEPAGEMEYPPEASGLKYGSIFGSKRPWCPPGFIEWFRENYPNGDIPRNVGPMLQYNEVREVFEDQDNIQALVDGGVDLGALEGAALEEEEDDGELIQ